MKNFKKGGILLPLVLLLILGGIIYTIGLKFNSKQSDLQTLEKHILWLDLHTISIKEAIKKELTTRDLQDFSTMRFNLGSYEYTAIIKKVESAHIYPQNRFYFVDVYGRFLDSNNEFLQEFTTRRSFIINF